MSGAAAVRKRARNLARDLSSLDQALYRAVAATPSPTLDLPLRWLSTAANRSLLWIALAGACAALGGRDGRRAAVAGLASIGAASALVNLGLKPIRQRTRPDRVAAGVALARRVHMPSSSSFPSGHSASGFAFAAAVGHEVPVLALPLGALAAAVAYSRVHTGVHYPADALVGSLVGAATGTVVAGLLDRATAPHSRAASAG
jgi:membrane-associated phospholipid phosphatase